MQEPQASNNSSNKEPTMLMQILMQKKEGLTQTIPLHNLLNNSKMRKKKNNFHLKRFVMLSILMLHLSMKSQLPKEKTKKLSPQIAQFALTFWKQVRWLRL